MIYPVLKRKMGIDIDNCIADTLGVNGGGICEILGENPYNISHWNYLADKYTKRTFFKAYRQAWKSGNIAPIETSKQVFSFMQAMRKMNIQVDYVSGIPEDCEQYLRDWLIKNELAFADIVRVGNVQDKVALGYQLFVDDSPLLQIRDGQTLFLYNQSWNENVIYNVYENVHRVFSLAEVVKLLNKEATNDFC